MRVHVCGLPNYLSKNDIVALFEEVGTVDQFKYSGAHADHCVEFEMVATEAYLALGKYDGVVFDEVPIKVRVT